MEKNTGENRRHRGRRIAATLGSVALVAGSVAGARYWYVDHFEPKPSATSYVDCRRNPAGMTALSVDTNRSVHALLGDYAKNSDGSLRWDDQDQVQTYGDGDVAVTSDGLGPLLSYSQVPATESELFSGPHGTTTIQQTGGAGMVTVRYHCTPPPAYHSYKVSQTCAPKQRSLWLPVGSGNFSYIARSFGQGITSAEISNGNLGLAECPKPIADTDMQRATPSSVIAVTGKSAICLAISGNGAGPQHVCTEVIALCPDMTAH